ncbi:hypothetical protein G7085_20665 [Tessaracoccus sp. HDW20]|uniref:hypothetical protein n=1 Tax=Tessaracoccus coleopterorum TaxID=2714950 RepID=UPI0018D30C03|nr:hypothetical protein [Tessaracoccus coleopterorum]NHB86117.1 hypothetical protein [Tessaracoccus coleopterorum]
MGRSQFALTWADVTERHEAAHLVDEARRYFQLLAENASEVVIRSNLPGILEWISPSVEKVLGWTLPSCRALPYPT